MTLSGLVLPVGGIKEKMLAARRLGIRRVIIPKQNEKDLRDLPSDARNDMEFILAEHVHEVLRAAIPACRQDSIVPRGAWWEVEHRENRLIGRDSPAYTLRG